MAAYVRKSDKKKRPGGTELRAMSVDELKKALVEHKDNLMQARFKHATAALEKTSELKYTRRQIARIETILTEKEQKV